jgi:hypothetical protein
MEHRDECLEVTASRGGEEGVDRSELRGETAHK